MLDVCVDFVGRDGVRDMHEVIFRFVNQIKEGVPFMLDSTNPAVMEAGLKLAGGRCVLNSMNLEDGEERVAHICGMAKKYGAAVGEAPDERPNGIPSDLGHVADVKSTVDITAGYEATHRGIILKTQRRGLAALRQAEGDKEW